MLSQSTRERLQALVQHPNFEGSVGIQDRKIVFDGRTRFYTDVNIHGEGFNVFTLLADLFQDMKIGEIKPFNVDVGNKFSFGDKAGGEIEGACVSIWACYGEKIKAPAPTGTDEKIHQDNYTESEAVSQ